VYYIGDGQHLYTFLTESGLSVRAVIIDIEDYEGTMGVITTLNNTSRGWSLPQYIKGWAKLDKVAYEQLLVLKRAFGVQFSLLASIIMGTTQTEAKRKIKCGEFNVRVEAPRINMIMGFMQNFELRTSIRMKQTHTASGLVTFMETIGLDEYKTIENDFIESVNRYNKKNPIPSFARETDSHELWMRIYDKL
jgi:hypothetical protein